MPKKRENNEGSIVRRKDGLWIASITIGREPLTGRLKRDYFYVKKRQEAHQSPLRQRTGHFCRAP
jgi:hypothetical protein